MFGISIIGWIALLLFNRCFLKAGVVMGIVFLQMTQVCLAEKSKFEIGTGLMYFDYAEYSKKNIFLDGETGFVPGLILKIKQNRESYYSQWVGSIYYNQVDYDGETQKKGIPVKTKSDAFILDTHVKFGKKFASLFERKQSIYIGLGYRYWLRNILSTTIDAPALPEHGQSVSGILEEYSWYYALLGYTASFNASDKVDIGLDLRLTKMFNGQIDIDSLGFCGYDDLRLDLGNELGARFAMPLAVKLSESVMTISPYYEIIDIGRSNVGLHRRNGALVDCDSDGYYDGAVEPRSETRNIGVEITWQW